MQKLDKSALLSTVQDKLITQDYGEDKVIEGVKIEEIKVYGSEDGTFEQVVKLDENGRLPAFPDFQVKQINRSEIIGGTIKAWHIHLNQEDIWYVAQNEHMILGLWDLRDSSTTKDMKMRVVLGNGTAKLVYIPRGVAHGVVNVSRKSGSVIYFVNEHYNPEKPDELRLPWDKAGEDFWQVKRE